MSNYELEITATGSELAKLKKMKKSQKKKQEIEHRYKCLKEDKDIL